jgi:hypothetical protein
MLGHYTTAPGWRKQHIKLVAGRMIPENRATVKSSELPIFEMAAFLLRRSPYAPDDYTFFPVLYNEKGKTCSILLLDAPNVLYWRRLCGSQHD